VKNENKPATAEKEKTMKLEEIKNKTNEAVSYLVAALESGQSDVLTQYLNTMARFHNYSFGNIMLIARQRAVTCCYTSLESMDMRSCALLDASNGA
jgi:DNA-binding phage protein